MGRATQLADPVNRGPYRPPVERTYEASTPWITLIHMADAPYKLILLRHGESEWNAKNLFTGWVDVNLNEKGEKEAVRGGELLKDAGLLPDVVHTSLQKRAIRTAQLALESADRHWIPVHRSWRLNERHYGALQGKDKAQTLAEFGEEQFMLWRRSYDTPPPPLEDGTEFSQSDDPRYATIPPELRPRTECLKDVVLRMLPYWYDGIVPDLLTGRTVLVAAHGNSLRALVKHLDGISDADIAGLNIPTGIPLSYELDADFKPLTPRGTYLDPDAAAAAIEAVKNQGKKK
ncbi:2,3-bisphosphoglycerate-dependent phosphoglycerate mutase [Streptomyces sp. LBL]|nr:2,3-bisphosphoglycerate-dependent phosphoglycerate mutase [Streptomyces sp. LBL]